MHVSTASILSGVLLLVAPLPATLEGSVRDRRSSVPLVGAEVTLVVTGRTVVTDGEGRFSFGEIDAQVADTLLVTHADYVAVRLPLGAAGDVAWTLDITIVPEPARVELSRRDRTP